MSYLDGSVKNYRNLIGQTANVLTPTNMIPGTVTQINTGAGLTGGPITTSGTIALTATGVTANTYTNATVTVDVNGRVTAASNGTGFPEQTAVTVAAGQTVNLAPDSAKYQLVTGANDVVFTLPAPGVTMPGKEFVFVSQQTGFFNIILSGSLAPTERHFVSPGQSLTVACDGASGWLVTSQTVAVAQENGGNSFPSALNVGTWNTVPSEYTVAVGILCVSGQGGAAFGYATQAVGGASCAIGAADGVSTTLASGSYAVALGTGAQSTGLSSTALGAGANATAAHAVAVGHATTAGVDDSVAIGDNAVTGTVAGGGAGLALGVPADTVEAGAPAAATDKLYVMIRGIRYHIALTAAP